MAIQFHLTNKCNLRCKHCYQGNYQGITMSLDDFKLSLDRILPYHNQNIPTSQIAITGGEPFIIPNILDYIEYAATKFEKVVILTNGLFLTDEICKELKKIKNFKTIQMSLEGTKDINDKIRGKGVYDKVLEKIELLAKYNINSSISCTINTYNYNIIDKLYYDLNNTSLNVLWFDRCIPFKTNEYLDLDQFAEFILKLKKIKNSYIEGKTKLMPLNRRALQYFAENKSITEIYNCGAGTRILIIMENGDIMPCRRLNYRIGNIFKESIESIMKRNKDFIDSIHKIPDDCTSCTFSNYCRGGLKCLTFNKYNDFNHKDINCVL